VTVSGHTRLAAVIGDPVRHSLSPVMHNAAFDAVGLDWVFVALPVAAGAGAQALDAMRVLGIDGLSVTMPHKAAAAEACDEVRGDAAVLRSVNCVSRGEHGALVGESTDGEGFLRSLREAGHEPAGIDAVVLGAGGVGRAVALALARAGAAVRVTARRWEAAVECAALGAGITAVDWRGAAEAVRDCRLVVNGTPIGMAARGVDPAAELAALPFSGDDLGPGQVVADLVYLPRRTPLLELAAGRGAATVEGIGMLVHQGAIAFERWTGVPGPVDVMRTVALAALG
jgi:shikimate dehydrogenase